MAIESPGHGAGEPSDDYLLRQGNAILTMLQASPPVPSADGKSVIDLVASLLRIVPAEYLRWQADTRLAFLAGCLQGAVISTESYWEWSGANASDAAKIAVSHDAAYLALLDAYGEILAVVGRELAATLAQLATMPAPVIELAIMVAQSIAPMIGPEAQAHPASTAYFAAITPIEHALILEAAGTASAEAA